MNQYGTQILSPNFLEQGSYSKLLKKNFDTGPNHGGGPSIPLKHTVDICIIIPQNTLHAKLA